MDYEFFFSSINIGLEKVGLSVYEPDVLISDAAGAIHNGYKNVFASTKIVMCWAHMRNNTKKFVEKTVDKKKQAGIMKDIDMLQLSGSKEIFLKASKLFYEKYVRKQHLSNILPASGYQKTKAGSKATQTLHHLLTMRWKQRIELLRMRTLSETDYPFLDLWYYYPKW